MPVNYGSRTAPRNALAHLGFGRNPVSSSLQGSSTYLQGSSPLLQPAQSRLQVTQPGSRLQFGATTGAMGGVLGATDTPVAPGGGGGGGLAGAAVSATNGQLADIEAARQDVKAQLDRASKLYDMLTGDVERLTASRRGEFEEGYQRELGNLAEGELEDIRQTSRRHAARGLADSGYLFDAKDLIGKNYDQEELAMGEERRSKLAELGQYATTARAGFESGQDYLTSLLDDITSAEDVNSLSALENDVRSRIASLTEQRAGLGTTSDFVRSLNKIAPTTGRVASLRSRLNTIANSPAPPAEKRRVAMGFISSSGLTPEEQDELTDFYESLGA